MAQASVEGHARPGLRHGQLNLLHAVVSTLANVGPAQGMFFSIAFLAGTMGTSSPFGFILATVAILTVGNTLAEFSKEIPSAGSFVTFISRTFGAYTGIALAVTVSIGYIIAISGVALEIGGWVSAVMQQNFHAAVPWQAITLVACALIALLTVRGVRLSSQWTIALFFTEAIVLLLLAASILLHGGAHGLSAAPLLPFSITGGLKSLGLAFPLLVFNFVGWENSGALAEETQNPRRNIARAVYLAIGVGAVLYVLSTYGAIEGYGTAHLGALANDPAPFNTLAQRYLGTAGVYLIDLIGFTSLFACVIAATNSQSRIIFHAGREGLIPRFFGRIHPTLRTPWTALLTYLGIVVLLIVFVGWNMQPLTFYADMGTLGTIPLVVMYVAANIALPIYFLRQRREAFRPWRHLVVPLVGIIVMLWSLWALIAPGQPAPFSWFPYFTLGVIAVSVVYALWLGRRDRSVLDVASQTLAE